MSRPKKILKQEVKQEADEKVEIQPESPKKDDKTERLAYLHSLYEALKTEGITQISKLEAMIAELQK